MSVKRTLKSPLITALILHPRAHLLISASSLLCINAHVCQSWDSTALLKGTIIVSSVDCPRKQLSSVGVYEQHTPPAPPWIRNRMCNLPKHYYHHCIIVLKDYKLLSEHNKELQCCIRTQCSYCDSSNNKWSKCKLSLLIKPLRRGWQAARYVSTDCWTEKVQ